MTLAVLSTGVLTTVQDRGRRGLAHLGVPRAGALDAPAAALANRLVGNHPDAAVLEVTLGGLSFRAGTGLWIAVTGAPAPVRVAGRARGVQRPEWVPAGAVVTLDPPAIGVRSYVAVSGGIAVPPVLGSRATDTLAWVGPPRVAPGDRLPLGGATEPRPLDTPPVRRPGELRLHPGPRADWFAPAALDRLTATTWRVEPASDRIGLRLAGPPLPRSREGELASEGMVLGAVQVPPSGQPIVFLADHPPTGGYPVIAVVEEADLWRCAQARPGEPIRFTTTG
ncbi:biotin-dependent carboxyltransferase family protein [Nocardioides sp.]|uniref:5-oxoprolinase subunit C family protein n=1 Tax=Nocardioides sp. TaxID=35761 RepID=UPI0039E2D7AC